MIKKVIFKINVSWWGALVKKCILIAHRKCISPNGFGAERACMLKVISAKCFEVGTEKFEIVDIDGHAKINWLPTGLALIP